MLDPEELEIEVRCGRCNGSGAVPIVSGGSFMEDGIIPPDIPLEMCPRCQGQGTLPEHEA